MILYCAADLLWASKIKATADALSVPCRPARNVEMLDARLVDSPVRAVIVDLEAEHALAVLERLAAVRAGEGSTKQIRVVAFGPHVATDALEAARRAGADSVLTRGALNAKLETLLVSLDAHRAEG